VGAIRTGAFGMSLSAHQTSHDLLREMLRGDLLAAVESGKGGLGSVQGRASAALYELLCDHPVDRRGRCRSCRQPRAVFRRKPRFCRVYLAARYYLHQRAEVLLGHLVRELHQDAVPQRGVADPPSCSAVRAVADGLEVTEVLPRIEADSFAARGERRNAPAVPPLPPDGSTRAGRSDPTRGGAGEPPEAPGLAVLHPMITRR